MCDVPSIVVLLLLLLLLLYETNEYQAICRGSNRVSPRHEAELLVHSSTMCSAGTFTSLPINTFTIARNGRWMT